MRELEIKGKISDLFHAEIEAARGSMPLDHFVFHLIKIGWTHFQDEMDHKQREESYKELAALTKNFNGSLAVHNIEPVPASNKAANVAAFGGDMTRRNGSL